MCYLVLQVNQFDTPQTDASNFIYPLSNLQRKKTTADPIFSLFSQANLVDERVLFGLVRLSFGRGDGLGGLSWEVFFFFLVENSRLEFPWKNRCENTFVWLNILNLLLKTQVHGEFQCQIEKKNGIFPSWDDCTYRFCSFAWRRRVGLTKHVLIHWAGDPSHSDNQRRRKNRGRSWNPRWVHRWVLSVAACVVPSMERLGAEIFEMLSTKYFPIYIFIESMRDVYIYI